jgi:hypothetical protein
MVSCATEEQYAMIKFLQAEGIRGMKIHQRLSAQYGKKVFPRQSVYRWIDMFKNGQTDVTEEVISGNQPTLIGKTTPTNCASSLW